MSINPAGTGISSMVAQAMALQESQMHNDKNIALLDDSLDIQKDLMAGILKSLGKGQNIDIVV